MPRMVLLHVWTSANFGRDFNLSRTLSVTCINSPSPSEVVLRRAPRCYWTIYAPQDVTFSLLRSGKQKASSIKHKAPGTLWDSNRCSRMDWTASSQSFADRKASSKLSALSALTSGIRSHDESAAKVQKKKTHTPSKKLCHTSKMLLWVRVPTFGLQKNLATIATKISKRSISQGEASVRKPQAHWLQGPHESKNDQASSKTWTLDSCFGLVGSHQQGAELC